VVAGLMFFTLIVTVWAVFRYHLLGRLNGMETAVRALSTGDYDVTIATGDQDPLAPSGGPSSSSARTPASGCASKTSCGATSRCSRARSPSAPPN
jgi:hypothetical protein